MKTKIRAKICGLTRAEDGKAYRLDLSFLARFAQIRELELCCRLHPQTDLSPVYALENLHSLRWLPDREIDIARFPHLKNLQTAHAFASLHSPTLENLTLSAPANLLFLAQMPNIRALEIRDYAGSSLQGLESLSRLENLIIRYGRKLADFGALAQCPHLAALEMEGIPPDADLSPLARCPRLHTLHLHTLADCAFVAAMPSLQDFICKDIANNDLTPLLCSPTLRYVYLAKHKRAYNVSKQELAQRFAGA